MTSLTSPAGTRVEVDPNLARVLVEKGWKPIPAPAAPAKRTPAKK